MAVAPKEIAEVLKAPQEGFQNHPEEILNTIGFACESNFEIKPEVEEAMKANSALLSTLTPEQLREGFERIISSKKAGEGLSMLIKVGAMDSILGEDVAQHLKTKEINQLTTYIENIDKTLQTKLRRMALFYTCFEPKKAEKAMKRLFFTEEEETNILDAIHMLDKMYFLTNKYDMKKFLVKYGMERYDFLHQLSKAQRIVYDLPVNRVESRDFLLKNIREWNEPIFEDELAISRDDLRELGIGSEEVYDTVFRDLLDLAHIKPNLNTKDDMLEYAEKYCKHPWLGAFKKLRYIK
ncbi:MAG: hypothetical protein ACI4LO_04805 [Anaerovoracaceae bacterium]